MARYQAFTVVAALRSGYLRVRPTSPIPQRADARSATGFRRRSSEDNQRITATKHAPSRIGANSLFPREQPDFASDWAGPPSQRAGSSHVLLFPIQHAPFEISFPFCRA